MLSRGIRVSRGAVEMLLRRAGITGTAGRPTWQHTKPDNIVRSLVDRCFTRTSPN